MTAYYNEIEPYAAEWLRNLIKAGQIADGVVDERDIRDVTPDELREYTQCHFFAGIGVWSHALRSAGWPDTRPVWTGSCPCQPFSSAGKGDGFADERHLWPDWHHLIAECRPAVVFGEQVASKDGLAWFDLVSSDMEGTGYAIAAADLCAAGVGAPHIRQRLWFVGERLADAGRIGRPPRRQWDYPSHDGAKPVPAVENGGLGDLFDQRPQGRLPGRSSEKRQDIDGHFGCDGAVGDMAHDDLEQHQGPHRGSGKGDGAQSKGAATEPSGHRQSDNLADTTGRGQPIIGDAPQPRQGRHADSGLNASGGLADSDSPSRAQHEHQSGRRAAPRPQDAAISSGDIGGLEYTNQPDAAEGRAQRRGEFGGVGGDQSPGETDEPTGPTNGIWRDADWIFCRDGKWRPVEPGTFPLAHGVTNRVGRLRAYGNAIVAEAAQTFIEAYQETGNDL